jgi:hypothetical protein
MAENTRIGWEGARIKHLELVQAVVSRMAANSFWLKGWSVTLVAAIVALATKDASPRIALLAVVPVLIFWLLDAYFLRQERLYRKLYDHVRLQRSEEVDFSLDATRFAGQVKGLGGVMFSVTLFWFYAGLLAVGAVVAVAIAGR